MSELLLTQPSKGSTQALSHRELLGWAADEFRDRPRLQPARSIRRLLLPIIRTAIDARCWRAESVGMWKFKPVPFEIVLESPAAAPLALQRAALLLTVTEIIRHYRRMIAFAADL